MKFHCAVFFALSLSGLWAQEWRTATDLPGVSWEGVKPAQQKTALAVLRGSACPCGCPMQLAQCRVEDPACGVSKTLAAMVVEAAAAGQDEAAIRKTLAASPLMKAAGDRNRVLLDPVEIPVDGSPAKGPAKARIELVEFSDFQCPFCIRAVKQLDAALAAFPADVRLVYKQFPLDTHSQAFLAAQASLAAHEQGKFWPLHDRLYAGARQINRTNILAWAKELGFDMPRFVTAMDSDATRARVARDQADGGRAGVEGTPTIFINGKKYQGSLEPAVFLRVLEAELNPKTVK